jgi:hypothetical protein
MRRAQRAHARETQGMLWVGEGSVNLWSVTTSRRCSTDRKPVGHAALVFSETCSKSLCHSSGRFEFTDLAAFKKRRQIDQEQSHALGGIPGAGTG